MSLVASYRAVLKIAPTAPLLVTRVAQVQDFTSDPLRLAGQPLGSGMTGVQLAEKPPKIDPGFGDAVRVTGAFNEKLPVQPSSQLMRAVRRFGAHTPPETMATRPALLPACECGLSYCAVLKIAPTVALSPIVTEHVQDCTSFDFAVQPLGSGMTGVQLAEKPPKNDPLFGAAVSVITEFSGKFEIVRFCHAVISA